MKIIASGQARVFAVQVRASEGMTVFIDCTRDSV
jgi:hypothetical protein